MCPRFTLNAFMEGEQRMKKKALTLIALATLLSGCANNNEQISSSSLEPIPTKVDCNEITVMRNGVEYDWHRYESNNACVFEYSNIDDTKMVYLPNHYTYYNEDRTVEHDSKVYVTENGKSEEFYFSDFIGFLKYEVNYYIDIDKKVLDIETKWSLWEKADPYAVTIGINKEIRPSDNALALECAKKGYYTGINAVDSTFVTLNIDDMDGSLERHKYITYPEDVTFEYTPKWF